jgi:two-component system heavy metal sensor histidine kinase CusS
MLERLQSDFAKLQEFSSDLAHELRTPINNLLTQTQVSLAQKRDASAYQDILASNAEEFQRLARMVSDMLFLAKTEHGIELPNPEVISLEQETRALFDFYDAVADEKHIRLSVSGDAQIMGDRLMIRRAIGNLLSNALRHSPAEAEVAVTIEGKESGATLCLTNSGPTIAPEVLPRLFDRFFRVDKSRSHPNSDGAGLGLSITQAIMAAHGGRVQVNSGNGKTTFCLVFQGPVLMPRSPSD